MAPFSIPAPCIIPLRVPVFGIKRSLDTETLIELTSETVLDHEIFYTLDGTRPQPYAGIVQGSKLHKYKSPFCLPPGKITIKAIAVHVPIHTMRSNVITKTFDVIKAEKKVVPKNIGSELMGSLVVDSLANDGYNSHPHNSEPDDHLQKRLESTFEVSLSEYNLGESGADEVTESLSECSFTSEVELKVDKKDSGDILMPESKANFNDNERQDQAFISDSIVHEDDLNKRIAETDAPDECDTSNLCCIKCATLLVHCKNCNTPSAMTSKFCYQCGMRLFSACANCKELNSVAALFCQSCGKKMQSEENAEKAEKVSYADCSVMAEPLTSHASIQQTINSMNKFSQTVRGRANNSSKKSPAFPKTSRIPSHSPGRGYWRQQVDYVCNHLKSYAYNDLKFREAISTPILNEFKAAHISKSHDEVNISVVFSQLEFDMDIDNKDMPSDASN